jgi:ribosomal protein S18 acetylase RimI-like enzyme
MSSLPAFLDSGLPAPGAAVRVRAARIRDWARLQGLMCSVFPHIDQATYGHWLRDQRHCLAVAFTAEGLVGVVRFEIQPGNRVTMLTQLGVAPAMRGHGVARALLSYCEEVACACGAPNLALELPCDDLVTLAFFRHLGYAVSPAEPSSAVGTRRLVRRAKAPVWPTWQLKREHAPRVPPAAFQRLAMRALYGAWLGSSARAG